jgi:hypothetical protein
MQEIEGEEAHVLSAMVREIAKAVGLSVGCPPYHCLSPPAQEPAEL